MKNFNIIVDENIPFASEMFSRLGHVRTIPGRAIKPETLKGFDILIVRSVTRVDRELLDGSSVTFVATATVGTDHVDLNYLKEKGIEFCSAEGSNARSVFEYVFTALFHYAAFNDLDIQKLKMGVVGVGNIGSLVADSAEKLGITVFRNDPPLMQSGQVKNVHFYNLDELMHCDVITLHTPLTKEGEHPTYHLFDKKVLYRISKRALLINTARGSVIDNLYLKDRLIQQRLKDAVLDVWEKEPFIDMELFDQVFLGTPHIAGYSLDGKINGTVMIFNKICDHLSIEKKVKTSDFLSPPGDDLREVVCEESYERTIDGLLRSIYDIGSDSRNMKQIVTSGDSAMTGDIFDRLRRDYPDRREFFNYRIALDRKCEFYDRLVRDLPVLGFRLK